LRLAPVKRISTSHILVALLAVFTAANVDANDGASPASKAESPTVSPEHSSHSHWAFKPPVRPEVPETTTRTWIRNPIDAFVLSRLEKEKLAPSPEADRRTLIRRLSFDLLGLPPRIEDVDAFVADKRPDAYDLLVDRLLASPHFGERWGRHWLDLARYADSDGYEKDTARPYAYLFRDWVIDAVNRDLPFDQFSIEQLAGDLLPGPTEAQKIATGFHRNTLTNKEGGVDQEEFRCKATVDRVSTTATVWLGLTVGCAECHNHKYDPIAQREFYQLYAFFNNASEKDLPAPGPAELAQYRQEKERWDEERDRLQSELAAYLREKAAANQTAWEQKVKLPAERWAILTVTKAASAGGSDLKVQNDGTVVVTGKNPDKDTYTLEATTDLKNVTGFRLEVFDDPAPGKGPGRSRNGNFVLSEFKVNVELESERDWKSAATGPATPQESRRAGSPHPNPLPKEREKQAAPAATSDRSKPAPALESTLPLPKGEGRGEGEGIAKPIEGSEHRKSRAVTPITLQQASADHAPKDWPVEGAIDGNAKTGWAIDPQFDQRHVAVFETEENIEVPAGAKLIFHLDQQYGSQHTLERFRLAATSSSGPLKADLMPDSIVWILETPVERRTQKEKDALAKYYREVVDPSTRTLNGQLVAHAKKESKFPETKAQTLAENEKPRQTYIHIRGDFLRKGEEVMPGTLAVLHAFKSRKVGQASSLPPVEKHSQEGPSSGSKEGTGWKPVLPDRLDLAEWLFDPANPLTARVTANRIWSRLFGRGLVATENDFGTRGESPSHPELLDWLATEFQRLGWSRKELIKLIVTSSVYRQSSEPRSELLARDPNNLLLARQSRFRLEAECVRDAFLSAAGLISPVIGGPSIRPPLPSDIAALGYANSVKWKDSEGADRYRRGLYIHFQRTVPYPMLMTFDAPDSNVTCTRRERSNTPLQALTTLNDPVFYECAQALGRRIAGQPAADASDQIRRVFELCLSRPPTKAEFDRLTRLHEDYSELIRRAPEQAAPIAGSHGGDAGRSAEIAALVGVARTVMNLDEFVTRE